MLSQQQPSKQQQCATQNSGNPTRKKFKTFCIMTKQLPTK